MADSVELAISVIDNASAPLKNIQRTMGGTTDALKDATRATPKMAGGIGAALGPAAALGTALTVAAGVAVKLGLALAEAGIKAAAALTEATFEASMFREKSVLAFKMLGKGAFNAEEQVDRVKSLAMKLGLPFEDTIDSFKKLLAMQFSPKAAEDVIKMTSDLKAIGAGADEVKRAIMAMTQIKAKGKVQTEELLQLAEAGVSLELVMAELGKATGKSGDELRKLLETGKITGEQGLAAIGEAIKKKVGIKEFGEAGATFASTTITGMVERVKNLKGFLMDEVAKHVKPAFEALKPIFDDIFKFLEGEDAKTALAAVGKGITAIFSAASAAWPVLREMFAAFKKGFQMGDVGPVKELFSSFAKFLGGDNAEQMETITFLAKSLGFWLGFLAGNALMAARIMAFLIGPIVVVAGWIGKVISAVRTAATDLPSLGSSIGTGLVDGFIAGIRAGIGKVTAAVKAVANAATGGLSSALQVSSPSKVFEGLGAMATAGFAGGLAKTTGIPSASASMATAATTGAAGGMTTGGASVNLTINVATQPGADGKDIASKIRPVVEQVLMQKFGGAAPA
jgi:tape measure domain-containing protein